MGKRMTTTTQQTSPSKKPVDSARPSPKHDHERVEKPAHNSRVEQLDWRGEGVVSNNHTD
jgi:hypothetical protein